MHPVLDEILRVRSGETVRPDVLRRWQHTIQHHVRPLFDEREALLDENARLREQLGARGRTRKGEAVTA